MPTPDPHALLRTLAEQAIELLRAALEADVLALKADHEQRQAECWALDARLTPEQREWLWPGFGVVPANGEPPGLESWWQAETARDLAALLLERACDDLAGAPLCYDGAECWRERTRGGVGQ